MTPPPKFPNRGWFRTHGSKWASREPTAEDVARRREADEEWMKRQVYTPEGRP